MRYIIFSPPEAGGRGHNGEGEEEKDKEDVAKDLIDRNWVSKQDKKEKLMLR